MIKLNTSMLYQLGLRAWPPDLVCDVGSRDGEHARRFRELLPRTRVVAFEANPHNARAMAADLRNREAGIEIRQCAVWEENGVIGFFVEHPPAGDDCKALRGLSSTRLRREEYRVTEGPTQISVPAIRLDTFVLDLAEAVQSIALWVDVEGAAFEVLAGIEGIRDRVDLIHVEVEDREVWRGQRLKRDVQELLTDWGFRELARGLTPIQHDLVFVSERLMTGFPFRVKGLIAISALLTPVARSRGAAAMLKRIERFARRVWRSP